MSDHPPLVPEDVPLLVDVVDEAEIGGGREAAQPLVLPEAPLASPPPVEAPSGRTRSARIKRMKESGLFQNG